jgi:spore maturation protein CgeB
MKIVVACMQHDYGVEARGPSYEYQNVYLPLADVAGEPPILFDFMATGRAVGRARMNQRLLELVANERPEVTLLCPFEDELDPRVLEKLRDHSRTGCYFFDDPWRQAFVRRWVRHLDFFTTPDYTMFLRYRAEGLAGAIFTPFGYNERIYRKLDLERCYDVSFVGGYSPLRRWIVDRLAAEGIRVQLFGRGWGAERWLGHEEMVEVFNRSRINLNLSNAACYDLEFLLHSLRSWRALRSIASLRKTREQVKGRHYEINGCGGFQLSHYVPGLNIAFELEREIVAYDDVRTMPELIRLYLKDEALREEIARRGHQRSLREHTAQGYLRRMLEQARGATLPSRTGPR